MRERKKSSHSGVPPGLCAGHGELLRKLLRNGSASLKTTVLTPKSPRADHTVPTQWLLLVLTRQQLWRAGNHSPFIIFTNHPAHCPRVCSRSALLVVFFFFFLPSWFNLAHYFNKFFCILFFFSLVLWERSSILNLGCVSNHYVTQASLQIKEIFLPPAPKSQDSCWKPPWLATSQQCFLFISALLSIFCCRRPASSRSRVLVVRPRAIRPHSTSFNNITPAAYF